MTAQLAALFSHHAVSIAVIPERVCSRAAHVLNESPPAKVGTLKTYVLTVQLAAAPSKPSPSTSSLSSVSATVVAKSCLYSEPSTPEHDPRQRIDAFLHSTLSSVHAWMSYTAWCAQRPKSLKISNLNRRHVSHRNWPVMRSMEPPARRW